MYYITLAHGKKTVNFVFKAVPFSCRCPTPLSSTVHLVKLKIFQNISMSKGIDYLHLGAIVIHNIYK